MKNNFSSMEDLQSEELEVHISQLQASKERASKLSNNEEAANGYWREIEYLQLINCFIKAFKCLKAKEYRSAWNLLEQCEISCKFLIENSSPEFQKQKRIVYIKELTQRYQSIFPYCIFISPAFKVGYYTCGICGHKVRPRSRCEHKKGRVYNGQLCLHIVHNLEVIEISIVDKPVQKYSVMHDDSTLDFSVIDYLLNALDNAFDPWDYKKTTMSFPRERFSMFSSNDKCPCNSGSVFSNCCEQKSEIAIPHIDFYFPKKPPKFNTEIRFPY